MRFQNPLPGDLDKEARKASEILASYIGSTSVLGASEVIPPEILANAKGLAVLSVVKAAFVGSARFGSGVVVARLADNTWSPPSAITTFGAGVGSQVGFEMTEFVFILNDYAAVQSFAQAGSLTFGGNASVAAGPLGRNAEAAGTASLKSLAAIFAYSKTKGLYLGVSLEGSGIIERRDENVKAYGPGATAKNILSGAVEVSPPNRFDALNQVLQSSLFSGTVLPGQGHYREDDFHGFDNVSGNNAGRHGAAPKNGAVPNGWASTRYAERTDLRNPFASDNDRSGSVSPGGAVVGQTNSHRSPFAPLTSNRVDSSPVGSTRRANGASSGGNIATALYTFESKVAGDLTFKRGDEITVVKKPTGDSSATWWTGRTEDGREGTFPSNYVRMTG